MSANSRSRKHLYPGFFGECKNKNVSGHSREAATQEFKCSCCKVRYTANVATRIGLGSTAGPIIASVAMVIFGPSGLFLVLAASAVGLVAFIAVRVKIRRRPAEELRNEFDMYSTLPVGAPVPDAEAVLAAAEDPVAPKEEEEAVV